VVVGLLASCISDPGVLCGRSYPPIPLVIHRKQGVIHRHTTLEWKPEAIAPQGLGEARTQEPGVGGVDIGWWAVEVARTRLLTVVVESLAQRNDLAPEVRVLLDQIGDACASMEDSGMVTPSQQGSNLG